MKKILIILSVILVLAASGFAIDFYLDTREDKQKHDAYAQLIPLIDLEESDDFETRVDKVRQFIFETSRYSAGQDFYDIWGDHEVIAQKIIAYANGEAEKRAPLECSSRAGALESIFITLGYNARSISVYKFKKGFPAHSFSEVQNPETGEWHIQDPQFNAFFKNKESGKRLSIAELIKAEFDEIVPCNAKGKCGWDLPNREGRRFEGFKAYMGLASIKDYQRGTRPLFVNAKRFDLEKSFEINGEQKTYCEHVPKNCAEEITIYK